MRKGLALFLHTTALCVWSSHVHAVCEWLFRGSSGFLPLSKNVQPKCTGVPKFTVCVTERIPRNGWLVSASHQLHYIYINDYLIIDIISSDSQLLHNQLNTLRITLLYWQLLHYWLVQMYKQGKYHITNIVPVKESTRHKYS